jgi:predicted DNA-binding transcriptional regulator YafY
MANTKDLKNWQKALRKPVRTSREPLVNLLLEASKNGEYVEIIYSGGSTPGTKRSIVPVQLFSVKGYDDSIYLEAICDLRKETRTFRLDRLELVSESLGSTSSPSNNQRPAKRKNSRTSKKDNDWAPSQSRQVSAGYSGSDRNLNTRTSDEKSSNKLSYGWLVWLAIGLLVLLFSF